MKSFNFSIYIILTIILSFITSARPTFGINSGPDNLLSDSLELKKEDLKKQLFDINSKLESPNSLESSVKKQLQLKQIEIELELQILEKELTNNRIVNTILNSLTSEKIMPPPENCQVQEKINKTPTKPLKNFVSLQVKRPINNQHHKADNFKAILKFFKERNMCRYISDRLSIHNYDELVKALNRGDCNFGFGANKAVYLKISSEGVPIACFQSKEDGTNGSRFLEEIKKEIGIRKYLPKEIAISIKEYKMPNGILITSKPNTNKKTTNHQWCLEFYDGTLTDLSQSTLSNSKNIIIETFRQILQHVQKLHKNGYCHRDLKPENILVKLSRNNIITIKLNDFGTTIKKRKGKNDVGTSIYFPPNNLKGEDCQKDDLFSLGVTFLEFLNHGDSVLNQKPIPHHINLQKSIQDYLHPSKDVKPKKAFIDIIKEHYIFPHQQSTNIVKAIEDLFNSLDPLKDPKKKITTQQIINKALNKLK